MSHVSVPVPTATFLRLASFLEESGSARDPVSVVEDAVDYWMDNAEWKKEDLLPDAVIAEDSRGYTWTIRKEAGRAASALFLPTGTALRIRVGHAFEYATVQGDLLTYKGEAVSPNQFAKRATGSARDAWRDLWIKRPSDGDYQHADALRQAQLGAS